MCFSLHFSIAESLVRKFLSKIKFRFHYCLLKESNCFIRIFYLFFFEDRIQPFFLFEMESFIPVVLYLDLLYGSFGIYELQCALNLRIRFLSISLNQLYYYCLIFANTYILLREYPLKKSNFPIFI